MSRKMFVSSTMGTDELVMDAAEIEPHAVLIWPWLIPHLDDWGRGTANPRQLKMKVFPAFAQVTVELIGAALEAFDKVGLIDLYPDDRGRPVMCVDEEAWWKYQTHIRKAKRDSDDSSFPAPPRDIARRSAENRASPRHATLRHASLHHDVRTSNLRLAQAWTPKPNTKDAIKAGEVIEEHPWVADLTDDHLGLLVGWAKANGTTMLGGLLRVAGDWQKPAPDWCGDCDEDTRLVKGSDGDSFCPECHPRNAS